MTSGWQGAPYFRRYERERVSKPAMALLYTPEYIIRSVGEGATVERLPSNIFGTFVSPFLFLDFNQTRGY